jgi:hypothetical protein
MSETSASWTPPPVAASTVPAIPLDRLYPPEGFWGHACHAVRVGWRPASGWVCAGVLLVNGVILPLARLKYPAIEPLDWHAMTPFAAMLVGMGGLRSWEKITGASI